MVVNCVDTWALHHDSDNIILISRNNKVFFKWKWINLELQISDDDGRVVREAHERNIATIQQSTDLIQQWGLIAEDHQTWVAHYIADEFRLVTDVLPIKACQPT